MTTNIQTTPLFDAKIKRLHKKYRGVKDELRILRQQLRDDERPGEKIPGVGYHVYKVRLGNPSAGRGKSGGFRVVYYIRRADAVLLLTIHNKSAASSQHSTGIVNRPRQGVARNPTPS
jgi:mRNA-degrading endonuclease RelE of RelBE toxin-antitoxin system